MLLASASRCGHAAGGGWRPISPIGSPSPRALAAGQLSGETWLLWGGSPVTSADGLGGDGATYDPKQDRWQPLPSNGAPSPRYLHTLTPYQGGRLVVWGGVGCPDLQSACADGAIYDPASGRWAALPASAPAAPSARSHHTAVWTGAELLVWGGQTANRRVLGDGARLSPSAGSSGGSGAGWSPLTDLLAPSPRRLHSATWTGAAMIIWGGSGATFPDQPLADGAAWTPATGAWKQLASAGAPLARFGHTAVWTGAELILFGGLGCGSRPGGEPGLCGAGARYDPVRDSWRPINAAGAPSPRSGHSAVWTGQEMIIWGGAAASCADGASGICADGAAYDPVADRWRPLATAGSAPRTGHLAAWTGSELLVWGGETGSCGGAACGPGELYRP